MMGLGLEAWKEKRGKPDERNKPDQLNETENLCMILENFYKMIDSRRWYFLEKDEKNNIFDILLFA